MNTTQTVVLTGAIVVAGRWQQNKGMDVSVVVGGAILALGLGALSSFNEEFARVVGLMVLVAALFTYLPGIVESVGFSGSLSEANRRRVG